MKFIYFDLDETIIDIKKAQNLACEYLYNYYGFYKKVDVETFIIKWDELTDYHYSFYTKKEISYNEQRRRRVIDLFATYDTELDKSPNEIYDIYLKAFEESWCLFDDVEDTIKKLHDLGYKLGVISNGDLNQQTDKLRRTGIIEYFDIIITSSEYPFSKPDSKIYEVALAKAGVEKNEMIMIGDQIKKDVLPCLKIGVESIWLNRNNEENSDNVREIKSLSELLNIVEEV